MTAHQRPASFSSYDADLTALAAAKDAWVSLDVAERIRILREIKRLTCDVAEGWAETAARKKLLPEGSPLAGEEWMTGPLGVVAACDALISTLRGLDGLAYLKELPRRYLPFGQLAVNVVPADLRDKLLVSGISAEVWMQPGISETNLPDTVARAYSEDLPGKVALVLGAGNIASIAPLDCFQKLFQENQVVLLKMNPVNGYLIDYLKMALKPLIDRDALRIVPGDGAAGAYLCEHPLVEEIHITGSGQTHDAIVWGSGAEGAKAKAAGTPRNPRPVTSELGAVCPTIVVPVPWSAVDIAFQAEHIATQKLHNSGFNCIACQALVMPSDWPKKEALLAAVKRAISRHERPAYYPQTAARIAEFANAGRSERISRGDAPPFELLDHATPAHGDLEVFGPAMSLKEIKGEGEAYLRAAIAFANEHLHGTLGAMILIHSKTLRAIGKRRFDLLLAELRYGCIGVNVWSGAGFLLPQVPWGAFPGHSLDDIGSGIGVVHNALMFGKSERTVVRGPWAPFPRSFREGDASIMPKPPWFVTQKHAHRVARGLVSYYGKPAFSKLAAIAWYALRG